jgi:DNA-binding transcriptional LysR family regulator
MSNIAMTDIRKVDFNLLVAFDALFDELSVSRTAERLALSQPTVSGMLNRLRDLFGDQLFVRTHGGMLPTPRAESLAVPVKSLLEDAKALVEPALFDPATAEMTFSITVNDYMQYALVIPFIEALREQAPRIRIAILPLVIAGLPTRLMRGEIDLAITIPQFSDPDLPSLLLYRDNYVGIVRRQHPLKRRRPSLEEFCRYDHLLVSPTGGSFTGPTDEALSRHGVSRNVAVSLPSFHVLLDVMRAVDFVALVPAHMLRGKRRDFRVFEPPIAVPGFDVIACWHARVSRHPAHRWLRELLATTARRMAGTAKGTVTKTLNRFEKNRGAAPRAPLLDRR